MRDLVWGTIREPRSTHHHQEAANNWAPGPIQRDPKTRRAKEQWELGNVAPRGPGSIRGSHVSALSGAVATPWRGRAPHSGPATALARRGRHHLPHACVKAVAVWGHCHRNSGATCGAGQCLSVSCELPGGWGRGGDALMLLWPKAMIQDSQATSVQWLPLRSSPVHANPGAEPRCPEPTGQWLRWGLQLGRPSAPHTFPKSPPAWLLPPPRGCVQCPHLSLGPLPQGSPARPLPEHGPCPQDRRWCKW